MMHHLRTLVATSLSIIAFGCGGSDAGKQNAPPTITNLPGTVTGHGRGMFTVKAEDPEGSSVSFALAKTTCSLEQAVNETTGEVQFECRATGSCELTVRVTDDKQATGEAILTINCQNNAPTLTPRPTGSASEGVAYSQIIACADNDFSDLLTLSVNTSIDTCGGAITVNDGFGGGIYRFTPAESLGGAYCTVGISCGDGIESTSISTLVAVVETNTTPIITALLPQSAHWGTQGGFTATATDADDPANAITWSLRNVTCTFTPSIDPHSGEVLFSCGAPEECTLTLLATDDGSPAKSGARDVALACSNQAPAISSTPATVAAEGAVYSYEIFCADPDDESVFLTPGDNDDCGGVLLDGQDGTGTYTFTPDESLGNGGCTFTVGCTDGHGETVQETEVSVAETNQAPVLLDLPTTAGVYELESGTFTVQANDADDPAPTLKFYIDSTTCSFETAPQIGLTSGEVSWTCGAVDTCAVTVRVSDDVADDTGTLTLACLPTAPGITSAAPETVAEGSTYSYSIVCSDPGGQEVELTETSDDCDGTLTDDGDGTGTFTFATDENDGPGTCSFALTCSDGALTGTQTTTVTIEEVNEAPYFTNLPASATAAHWRGTTPSFTVTAADDDLPANALAFSLASTNCPFTPSVDLQTGEVTWSCTGVADCTASIRVTDDAATPVGAEQDLLISCTNTPPVVDATKVPEYWGKLASRQVCSDPDGDPITLTVLAGTDTCGGTIVDSGTAYQLAPSTRDTCRVAVSCSDGVQAQTLDVPVETGPEFTQLSLGAADACGLLADGAVRCWGATIKYFDFGMSDWRYASRPVMAAAVAQVSVGAEHACAVDTDGNLACWGFNYYGQAAPPVTTGVVKVSAGTNHSCALLTDQTIRCWGEDVDGKLDAPTAPDDNDYIDVGAGYQLSCGLHQTGVVECWGTAAVNLPTETDFVKISLCRNSGLGLRSGDGAKAFGSSISYWPTGTYQDISAGMSHGCGLKLDGSLECGGSFTATTPTGTQFTKVYSDQRYSCALTDAGGPVCWGESLAKQGQATTPVGAGHTWVSVGHDVNNFAACAVTELGEPQCWGGFSSPAAPLVSFDLGAAHGCGLDSQGAIHCFGGIGSPPDDTGFTQLNSGSNYACALDSDGQIRCWGTGVPATVPSGSFISVGPGSSHACAVRSTDHSVVCWGTDGFYQSVSGKPAGTNFVKVVSGYQGSCVLDDTGKITCWGYANPIYSNFSGQPTGTGFVDIAYATYHACAIAADGTIDCWGRTGNNAVGNEAVPPAYGGWVSLDAAGYSTCALHQNGTYRCWGYNER